MLTMSLLPRDGYQSTRMQSECKKNMNAANSDFLRVVWPAIKFICDGGELHSCESDTSPVLDLLDKFSGIDWVQHLPGGVRGIAARVQWVDSAFPTYTIRCKTQSGNATEMEKRLKTDRGFFYPHMTVQAYIAKPRGSGQLLQVYVCETTALYDCVRSGNMQTKANPFDGNVFAIVDVADIKKCWTWNKAC